MNRSVGCGLGVIGGITGCAFTHYLLSFVVAVTVAEQLPEPVQAAARASIQAAPQAVGNYDESDFPARYSGQVIEEGACYWEPMHYSGPERFVCQVPVAGGNVTSEYGDPRPGGHSQSGIDYRSHYRSEDIYSPMGGMVTHAGWSYWLG